MVNVSHLTSGVANPEGRARFAEASTAEEWRARGASLLSTHRNFEAAATCFRNAGDVAGWLSATAEARRARANANANAAGSASAAAADLDAAAHRYLMHAAAVTASTDGGAGGNGGSGGGGGGGGGSVAGVSSALVKAAHCLHRLRRYADAAAALQLVGRGLHSSTSQLNLSRF